MNTSTALSAAALFVAIATGSALADENLNCDRSGDNKVTTVDALIALEAAVDTCRTSMECDADSDGSETVTDALLLLRFAVGLPVETSCSCTFVDECFGDDEDCIENGFPEGTLCVDGALCGECVDNNDCEDEKICDTCSDNCVAP